MRIGIDVRPLQSGHRFRGIGVYLGQLLAALADIGTEHEYVLFASRGSDPLEGLDLSRLDHRIVRLRRPAKNEVVDKAANAVWPANRPRRGVVDVLLVPDAARGVPRGTPVVCVVYDLIEMVFRSEYHPAARQLFAGGPKRILGGALRRWLYARSLRQLCRADRIIAISESTRRDLVHFVPCVTADSIAVVPLAPEPSYRPTDSEDVLAELGVVRPFLLYVGGVDFRKNVMGLVEAFDEVAATHPGVRLVLVGKEFVAARPAVEQRQLWRRLHRSPSRKAIHTLGYLTPAQLRALYSAAELFVYPSLYEGFGLPPLEAMACGCPVVAYNNSSLPEVVGDAAILLEPGESLAQRLNDLLADAGARAALAAAGPERARAFDWHRTAAETLKVLDGVVREHSR